MMEAVARATGGEYRHSVGARPAREEDAPDMKSSSTLKWGAAFVLGGAVGAAASFLLLSATAEDDELASQVATIPARPPTRRTKLPLDRRDADATVEIDVTTPDTELALALEQAVFDGQWNNVEAVAGVLRARSRTSRVTAPAHEPGERSLLELDAALRQRAFEQDLAGRENEATRIAASARSTQDKIRALADLFRAPTTDPAQAAVRRDAALLLGRIEHTEARAILLQALGEPDRQRAELAEEALAQARHPAVTEALLERAEADADPGLRLRAVRALADAPAVVRGGPAAARLAEVALRDRDPGVRSEAFTSLGRADLAASPPARAALARVIADPTDDPRVRQAATAALRAYRTIARTLDPALVEAAQRALPRPATSCAAS